MNKKKKEEKKKKEKKMKTVRKIRRGKKKGDDDLETPKSLEKTQGKQRDPRRRMVETRRQSERKRVKDRLLD